jgi:hypothetical protein
VIAKKSAVLKGDPLSYDFQPQNIEELKEALATKEYELGVIVGLLLETQEKVRLLEKRWKALRWDVVYALDKAYTAPQKDQDE